jgi:hypothetical protein
MDLACFKNCSQEAKRDPSERAEKIIVKWSTKRMTLLECSEREWRGFGSVDMFGRARGRRWSGSEGGERGMACGSARRLGCIGQVLHPLSVAAPTDWVDGGVFLWDVLRRSVRGRAQLGSCMSDADVCVAAKEADAALGWCICTSAQHLDPE